jgi:hypothetical protein
MIWLRFLRVPLRRKLPAAVVAMISGAYGNT